jgi:cytochrome c-type biogenesis protein CcmF
MIVWLWIGGLLMAVGTVLAAFPGNRRKPTAPVSELLPDPSGGRGVDPAADTVAHPVEGARV